MPTAKSTPQRIVLAAKPTDPRLPDTLRRLHAWLNQQGLQVLLEPNAAAVLGRGPDAGDLTELGAEVDLAVVVGGDGSLLTAARQLVDSEVPLVGVNLGRLGFLVDISPDDMCDSLQRILAGNFVEDRRFLLSAHIGERQELAFNDVVLHKWNTARLIEFETRINGRLLDVQRSDGVIICTPTGSTAYALSGGGPLLEPPLDAVGLVPICPHTLSNRPIVVSADSDLEIQLQVCGRTDPQDMRVTCDGQENLPLAPDQPVVIRRHSKAVRLYHPDNYDHFEVLRAKLGWGGLKV